MQKKFFADGGPSAGIFTSIFLHFYHKPENIVIFVLSEDVQYIWHVPITISTSDSPKEAAIKELLETKSSSIKIDNLTADKWFKVISLDCLLFL